MYGNNIFQCFPFSPPIILKASLILFVCLLWVFLQWKQQNKTNILHQCFSIKVQQLVNVFYYDVSRQEKKMLCGHTALMGVLVQPDREHTQ